MRLTAACRRFCHGDGRLVTVNLPTMYPVVTVLREHALPGSEVNPSPRPIDCFESWVTARQHRFREAPPIWAGDTHNLFVDAAGWLMTWGKGFAVPPGHADSIHSDPTPVAGMAGVRVRSLATGALHNIALGWDGRVYWWGTNPSNGCCFLRCR